jgi:hypothetical protein
MLLTREIPANNGGYGSPGRTPHPYPESRIPYSVFRIPYSVFRSQPPIRRLTTRVLCPFGWKTLRLM